MRFEHVCLESIAAVMPDEVWTSADLEERLRPLYERLKLPAGRLELMTGIAARRMWPAGTRPSEATAAAARAVLARSALRPADVGLFVHAAVSRDMLEPASASFAHRQLGLPDTMMTFDLSNACLGFLNALTVAAGLIESGQIGVALVAAGENGRPLVEETVRALLAEPLDRNQIKPFFANLTIGCGAVAAVLCHARLAPGRPHRLLGGTARVATGHSDLCQGDARERSLVMQTDSERMLEAGVALARETWDEFRRTLAWDPRTADRFICHQVGTAHRRRLYEALGLDVARDFSTFATWGNVGSVSLPATLAAAVEAGAVRDGDRVALLGIGSGLVCQMLGSNGSGAPPPRLAAPAVSV